eukprot:353848-Chlamydomonas_euryale.AAC.2
MPRHHRHNHCQQQERLVGSHVVARQTQSVATKDSDSTDAWTRRLAARGRLWQIECNAHAPAAAYDVRLHNGGPAIGLPFEPPIKVRLKGKACLAAFLGEARLGTRCCVGWAGLKLMHSNGLKAFARASSCLPSNERLRGHPAILRFGRRARI